MTSPKGCPEFRKVRSCIVCHCWVSTGRNTGSVGRPETRDLWEQKSGGTYPIPLGTGVAGRCCFLCCHMVSFRTLTSTACSKNSFIILSCWHPGYLLGFKTRQGFVDAILEPCSILLQPTHRSLQGSRCCPAKWPEQFVLGCFLLAPEQNPWEWEVRNPKIACFL